jgi:hypothetical protein
MGSIRDFVITAFVGDNTFLKPQFVGAKGSVIVSWCVNCVEGVASWGIRDSERYFVEEGEVICFSDGVVDFDHMRCSRQVD